MALLTDIEQLATLWIQKHFHIILFETSFKIDVKKMPTSLEGYIWNILDPNT